MNTLLNYPGAKWGMAAQIVALMPPHRSYLEPFFGSGAVLFNKPQSAIETVNDIDGDIVNFFRVLREQADRLAEAISLTPYAREVFDDAHTNRGTDDFDRAYRFAIRSKMGHGFKTYQKTGFKIDVYGRERSYCVGCWNRLPADLLDAARRLKGVQIEHQNALDLIRKFNQENVLIYADPPYLLETRGGKQYRHEMTEQDHLDLLDALKQHKGPVILSGYPSEMYDLELRGWSVIHRKSYNMSRKAADLSEWWSGQKNIVLMDANILACREHISLLEQLADSGACVDFNQGLDARLLTPENIAILRRIKLKEIHFAWDLMKNSKRIVQGLNLWKRYGKKDRHGAWGSVYVLTNFNTTMAENLYRIYKLRDMGFSPYVMVYDQPHAPQEVRRLQRWCNNKTIFKSCPRFEDYDANRR